MKNIKESYLGLSSNCALKSFVIKNDSTRSNHLTTVDKIMYYIIEY